MSPAHLQVAHGERTFEGRTGPKAAFDFYMSQKVHTARERQAEIRSAGNKKAQFPVYCDIFGLFADTKVKTAGAVHGVEQSELVAEDILAALQGDPQATLNALAKRFAVKAPVVQGRRSVGVQVFDQEQDDDVVPTVETSTTRNLRVATPAPIVAKRISFKMCMAVKRVCTKKGLDFSIEGKTGGDGTDSLADYTITVNGVALSPKEASDIIDANKKKKS